MGTCIICGQDKPLIDDICSDCHMDIFKRDFLTPTWKPEYEAARLTIHRLLGDARWHDVSSIYDQFLKDGVEIARDTVRGIMNGMVMDRHLETKNGLYRLPPIAND